MPTRRQVIEQALVAEREHLYTDLFQLLTLNHGNTPVTATGDAVSDCIERIRVIGEALGYPTDWRHIPAKALSWYTMIETAPEIGLHPMVGCPTNFPPGQEYLELTDVTRKAHQYVPRDDSDPDDFDFTR